MTKKRIANSLDDGPLAFFVQGLILFYLLSLSLETVPSLSNYADTFSTINMIVTAIFVAELFLRLIVAERPLKYLFSFYGIVDIIAILPALAGAHYACYESLNCSRANKSTML